MKILRNKKNNRFPAGDGVSGRSVRISREAERTLMNALGHGRGINNITCRATV